MADDLFLEPPAPTEPFDPLVLDKAVIAIPLLRELKAEKEIEAKALKAAKTALKPRADELAAAIELNPSFEGGIGGARDTAEAIFARAGCVVKRPGKTSPFNQRYLFAKAPAQLDAELRNANRDATQNGQRPILYAWPFHPKVYAVIIDLNLEASGGREETREWVTDNAAKIVGTSAAEGLGVSPSKNDPDSQYVFARLTRDQIEQLVNADSSDPGRKWRCIFRIWPDFPVKAFITRSLATVKADAAHHSFSALGEGITWAVMDSGVNKDHEHFQQHRNFEGLPERFHRDFTDTTATEMPFSDDDGHGTHVAGIIAGAPPERPKDNPYLAVSRFFNEQGNEEYRSEPITTPISGVAPKCKLVSLKVLDGNGNGAVSNLIAAIHHIQKMNGFGRRILIHGVNISLGYSFEPEWFACGQSPICVEVDRLVKSGVVVVVAAGNTGYGTVKTEFLGVKPAGLDVTINDPGNAELAVTVGSTHRDMPHIYGVSYFSSKGPTGDGRAKPDLVAPGEKIVSCAWGKLKEKGAGGQPCDYVETSGTSMAAPHVSGAIAAFLSVRREFIGQAERVKQIFVTNATDLRRDKYFQGAGLLDLMRAIQSV
ncbi:MAG: Peptidase and in, kexin, sedolisin [Chthoniobacter sp.]|nr:Peptidase and in, kexin, sedolisin [Chthoniobacter sp.]